MDLSSDSDDVPFHVINSNELTLQIENERLRCQLNELKIQSDSNQTSLVSSFTQQINALKQENFELKSRISLISQQNEQNYNEFLSKQNEIQQQSATNLSNANNQIREYKDQIKKIKESSQIEKQNNEKKYEEMNRKLSSLQLQNTNVLQTLSNYFDQHFSSLSHFVTFINSQQYTIKDSTAKYTKDIANLNKEINDMKIKYQKKRQTFKEALNSCANEISLLRNNLHSAETTITQYSSTISTYEEAIKDLKMQIEDKDHEIARFVKEQPVQQVEVQKNPQIIFQTENKTIKPPKPKVKYTIKDETEKYLTIIDKKERKIFNLKRANHQLKDCLQNADSNIEELKNTISNLQKEKHVLNSQLIEERNKPPIIKKEEAPDFTPVLNVTKRKLQRQKALLDQKNNEIEKLQTANEKLKDENNLMKIRVERLLTELKIAESRADNVKPIVIEEEPPEDVNFELTENLPFEVDAKIHDIANNKSSSISSKIKFVIQEVTSYYKSKIDESTNQSDQSTKKLKLLELSLAQFIPELTEASIGQHITLEAFVQSPDLQQKVIRSYYNAQSMSQRVAQMQEAVDAAEGAAAELRAKLAKAKREWKTSTCVDLPPDLRALQRENDELRARLDRTAIESSEAVRSARRQIVGEYETVIERLKARIETQKKSIESLSAKLAV